MKALSFAIVFCLAGISVGHLNASESFNSQANCIFLACGHFVDTSGTANYSVATSTTRLDLSLMDVTDDSGAFERLICFTPTGGPGAPNNIDHCEGQNRGLPRVRILDHETFSIVMMNASKPVIFHLVRP